jgi:hypothetical protein
MRKLLLFVATMLVSWTGFSQTTSLYYDNFDEYTVGNFIAVDNPTWWTTWSGLPGSGEDGQISDIYSSSPSNSVLIDVVPAASDLLLKLGDKTSGAYQLDWEMYVETNYAGYFNIQHFESPGIEWAYEVYFDKNGTGRLLAGSTTPFAFTYPKDTWFSVSNTINIDADLVEFWVNGVLVLSWPFHYQGGETTGTNQLGGVDFYAGAATGETPRYYFDNVDFKQLPTVLYSDNFESYAVDDFMAVVNPTWWTTWSDLPGSGEDGQIKDDFASSPTKSVSIDVVPSASDLILKLGDRISGSYDLNWQEYVETGKAGYFNIQHFQSPGIEWAYEVYFDADGTGRLLAGSTIPFAFNYPKDTWFTVQNLINIDADTVTLIIDGVTVLSWPFHFQADGTTGTNQLGGVDFYAGAATGETPKSHFDDLNFLQLIGAIDPIIALDPVSITATAPAGGVVEKPLTVTNDGAADLEYEIFVIYTPSGQVKASPAIVSTDKTERSLSYAVPSTDPDARPASYNPVTDDFVLHYDGDNDNSFSWGPNIPYTIVNAAMFPPALTLPHVGMMITSVDVFFNELGTDFSLRIYDMGNGFKPGELLVDQPFTPIAQSWNNIALDNPVYISGSEIWVGYQYTQPIADNYIPGVDAGPANINGDWISFGGVSWAHLTDYESDVNWNIRANLSGTPIAQWLSVAPASGLITPGNSDPLTVTCDATDLAVGTYTAILRVVSNDPDNPQIDVPVTFEVTEGGTPTSVILDFEEQADWSLTFGQWTALDVDGLPTYGFPGGDITFPHVGEPMAYIAFNPATTVPPMTGDPEIQPHGGVRFGACFDALSEPPIHNDDWLISPNIQLGIYSSLTLWVKTYSALYDLEQYNILVSTTDMNPASFTVISGDTPLEAPLTWTQVNYDLSDYDGQNVYIAIQCVSDEDLLFMVDDISVDFIVGVPDVAQDAEIAIYPNPATDHLTITSGIEMTQVDIFNQLGQKVFGQVVKDTNYSMNTEGLHAGVYFVKITTDQGITTKKIMVK